MRRHVSVLLYLITACDDPSHDPGDTATDAGQDAALTDAAPESDAAISLAPDAACDYVENAAGELVLGCEDGWETFVEMDAVSEDASCPTYYAVGDQVFAAVDDGVAALGCSRACVYRPRYAALFIHCDDRAEAITFEDGGAGQTSPAGSCPTLLLFESVAGGGWYPSWEAFEAAHPCP